MKPASHLLSFVTNADGTMLSIHLDLRGVSHLIQELELIREGLEADDCPHTHLFAGSDASGDGLSTSKLANQTAEETIVNHVKIYGWNAEWTGRHGLLQVAND